jgi:outer membrane protein OmpA-like peptidoglycan-associated protein
MTRVSRAALVSSREVADHMFVVFPSRGIGAAAVAAGLLLAGCSSDSDVPPTVVSAPGGGTQMNTDTGSGGNFPDVNTTPTQRPTSTIQDLAQAPDGLAAAQGGTQYGEALVGGPTSTAEPPPPPPPPEPPQEALAPIPEAGVQTQTSDATPAETPQATEPQQEPAAEPAPVAESEPVAEPAEPQGEGQTIQGTTGQAEPQPEVAPEPEPAPVASAPEPAEPVAPTYAEPQDVEPSQPAPVATPQQAPQPAYGSNQAAQAPEAYGVSTPQPNATQNYNSTQMAAAAPAPAPSQGQPRYGGEPVGLIYFRDGSSELSSDDLRVIEQIAEIQRAYGGVVSVVGHASVGGTGADQQANQRISEARATAVAQELMRYGVPLEAIRAGAAGDSQPLYSEAAANGQAGNRRVEVYITAY